MIPYLSGKASWMCVHINLLLCVLQRKQEKRGRLHWKYKVAAANLISLSLRVHNFSKVAGAFEYISSEQQNSLSTSSCFYLIRGVRVAAWKEAACAIFHARNLEWCAPISEKLLRAPPPQIRALQTHTLIFLSFSSVCENKCSSANVEIKLIARGVALFCAFFSRAPDAE